MKSYILHHRYAIQNAWYHLRVSWLATTMTIAVIAITLVLPLILWLMLANAEPVVNQWQGNPKASIYLQLDTSAEDIDALAKEFKGYDFVTSVQVISAQEALASFEDNADFGDILSVLDENPLPSSIILTMDPLKPADAIEPVFTRIQANPLVEDVRFDLQWVKRLQAIVELVKKVLSLIIVLVLVAAMLIISNTIRLIIANRKDEIATLNSVGATNAFIARPFLYSGFFKGATAALVAFLLVYLASNWLRPVLNNLYSLYFAEHMFIDFSFATQVSITLLSGMLGWLSSWLTVNVFLQQYKP